MIQMRTDFSFSFSHFVRKVTAFSYPSQMFQVIGLAVQNHFRFSVTRNCVKYFQQKEAIFERAIFQPTFSLFGFCLPEPKFLFYHVTFHFVAFVLICVSRKIKMTEFPASSCYASQHTRTSNRTIKKGGPFVCCRLCAFYFRVKEMLFVICLNNGSVALLLLLLFSHEILAFALN